MPYKRGDVVLVLFPDSNLRTAKRRPLSSFKQTISPADYHKQLSPWLQATWRVPDTRAESRCY